MPAGIQWMSFEEAVKINRTPPLKNCLLMFIQIGVVGAKKWMPLLLRKIQS